MMTSAQLKVQFERWTLGQPGYRWELNVYEPATIGGFRIIEDDVVVLRIYVETKDTYRPDQSLTVAHAYTVPPWMEDPDQFGGFLLQCVLKTVEHEAMEWLRRDGEIVFDPHAAGKRI